MANRNINGDVNVEFNEASSRQGLDSGESIKTLFGKIRKWLSDLKAVAFSGSYDDLTNKPTIPPIVISETSDTTPYIYKASEHDAVYDELVGGSVAWNQLVQNGNFESTSGWATSGGTMTTLSTANNILTISSTASINTSDVRLQQTINLVDAHKYLFTVTGYSSAAHNHQRDGGIEIYPMNINVITILFSTTKQTYYKVFKAAARSTVVSQIRLYSMDSITSHISNLFCIDLTQMFGPTIADYVYSLEQSTAGSGIAWLKSYGFFTKDYYAYSAGALTSVNVSGKKVVGKNLLEITTESTTINGVTFTVDKAAGTVTVNGTSTNLIGFPLCNYWLTNILTDNVAYTLTGCPSGGDYFNTYALYAAREGVGTVWRDVGNGETYTVISGEVLTPLYLLIRSGVTVNNLVFKPMIRRADVTDPTFEPYTSITYPIQSTDLRGLYKLNGNKLYTDGDIYSADGQITRKYGYRGYQSGDESLANAITDGTHTIYKLSAPTTATAQPFTSPQMVYRNGTEEYLDTRDVPLPVGGNRKYVDIPEWMVNEYFDDVRAETSTLLVKIENINNDINEIKSDMQGVTQDLDDISEELDCLIIRAALVNDEVRIQNTSDFTDELYSKYSSYTKPKFAILKLQITSNTYYYKALLNSSSVSQATVMEAAFITVNGTYMNIYNFNWSRSGTVGTPTVTRKSLNLGS